MAKVGDAINVFTAGRITRLSKSFLKSLPGCAEMETDPAACLRTGLGWTGLLGRSKPSAVSVTMNLDTILATANFATDAGLPSRRRKAISL